MIEVGFFIKEGFRIVVIIEDKVKIRFVVERGEEDD